MNSITQELLHIWIYGYNKDWIWKKRIKNQELTSLVAVWSDITVSVAMGTQEQCDPSQLLKIGLKERKKEGKKGMI